jgi:hypothetical protein
MKRCIICDHMFEGNKDACSNCLEAKYIIYSESFLGTTTWNVSQIEKETLKTIKLSNSMRFGYYRSLINKEKDEYKIVNIKQAITFFYLYRKIYVNFKNKEKELKEKYHNDVEVELNKILGEIEW